MSHNNTILAADLFCGAGGTSTGLLLAAERLGLSVELLAINHWEVAIASHSANHPHAVHLCENLDGVDPRKVVPGGRLDLLMASPECTHHSKARGGKPRSDQSRASAWHVLRWAEALHVENILIENVEEFKTWCPLGENGQPIERLKGKTYLAFLVALRSLGYHVSVRVLCCADYGDPTTRRRLFILARKGKRVRWPLPAYSKDGSETMFGKARHWRAAREIIDWSIPGPSIFSRKKPLSSNTIRRIEAGLRKFCGLPFVIGQQSGAAPRSVDHPVPTIAAAGAISLVEPFVVAVNYGACDDRTRTHSLEMPFPTVTGADVCRVGAAQGLAEPFIVEYYGTGGACSVDAPLSTQTTKDRFGLAQPLVFEAGGHRYLLDIRFRMLQPHELAAAMSFPKDYCFAGNREEKVKQIGNAVPVLTAAALCEALLS
ncbi:MAG: DNA cytosine methyltransferase [Syntrophaceae bacterium]|nr:DNA cytosine methyltransferase [Syntrophaceae bacterium]